MGRRALALALAATAVIVVGVVAWKVERPAATTPTAQPGPGTSAPSATSAAPRPPREPRAVFTKLTAPSPNQPLRPLPPLGTPLKTALPALVKQAGEGDAAAACRIAYELDRCRQLPNLRVAPVYWRQALARVPPDQRERMEANIAAAERTAAHAQSACEGIAEEDLGMAWDYVLAAALADNRHARWMMVSSPPGLDSGHPERTLEGWAQWRQHIARVIEAGLRDGDPRLTSMASWAYLRPLNGYRVFPDDRVRALALRLALVDVASPTYRKVEESNVDYTIREWQISRQDVDLARAMARQFTVRAADGGNDWSRGMMPHSEGTECERPR